ncbi:Phospholipase D zeta [Klebsormidium nitens]|uniref:Phospholipase n=1 Tax=Klebsormidium nitens TaxID=105231 RepID=A0A1Y1IAZ6_KLENI|nr:Phospholipase D zeta [Klebsormidium nitens]|eukprot:GAQ88090.1 Phospholipase D zeta [Klebsormidium nitens]
MARSEDHPSAERKGEYRPIEGQVAHDSAVDCDGNEKDAAAKAEAAVFEELPVARVTGVTRADVTDVQLVYTIEMRYRQFSWRLEKRAGQVLALHFRLKRRALTVELRTRQEQFKLYWDRQQENLKSYLDRLLPEHSFRGHSFRFSGGVAEGGEEGLEDPFREGGEPEAGQSTPRKVDVSVPVEAAFSVMKPTLGRSGSAAEDAMRVMQDYVNHFLENLELVNTREVCRFLEVSRLSFAREYGPKLHEGWLSVRHLADLDTEADDDEEGDKEQDLPPRKKTRPGWFRRLFSCFCGSTCCRGNWQEVWGVLKPGFLALLADPLDKKPVDIILFDVLQTAERNGGTERNDGMERKDEGVRLARPHKYKRPMWFGFEVAGGGRVLQIRTRHGAGSKDWVAAINEAGLQAPEAWCHPHRFGSFAPPRGMIADGSEAQWLVDGRAAFEAVANALESAKNEIYITGWWLCPDLFLRRPFASHGQSTVAAILEERARAGVQVYILMYKEVSIALKINSLYSKKKLQALHENIKVVRHPDHFSAGVYLWSHHEKIVVVDHRVAFLGGLDLCFGRYDTPEHSLGDLPATVWPGKDYYNPREREPNSWEDPHKDELERSRTPRMPWHDVHCALWGPPCRDVARHFVQRWNYAKRSKAPNQDAIPLLLPHQHMVIPHYRSGDEAREIEEQRKQEEQVIEAHALPDAASGEASEPPSRRSSVLSIPLLLPQEEAPTLTPGRFRGTHSHSRSADSLFRSVGTLFLGSVKTLGRANQSDDVGRLLDGEIGREDSGAFASTSGNAEMNDMAELRRSGSFTPPAGRGQRPVVKTLGLTWADAQESAARLREKWAQFARRGAFTPSGKRGPSTPSDKRGTLASAEKRGEFTPGSAGKGKKHLQVELMTGSETGGQERLEQPLLDTPQRRASGERGDETPHKQLEGESLVGASVPSGEAGQRVSCRCQIVRSVGQWSAGTTQAEERSIHEAYCTLITNAQHFVYIENQFFVSGLDEDDTIQNRVLQALFARILRAHRERATFRVIVVMPLLPGFQGGVDDAGAASVRAIMHWQYRTICRGKHSLLTRLAEELGTAAAVSEYVGFFALRSHGRLTPGGHVATSQVYVHSKLMLVDDRVALIGSANLNDRSLLGSRDSEIAAVIQDERYVPGAMDGRPWRAGRFAQSLRMALWAEHLGLKEADMDGIRDPVHDRTYWGLWMARAKSNTAIYEAALLCIPSDAIHSRSALRQAEAAQKAKAKEDVSRDQMTESKPSTSSLSSEVDGLLDAVRGHLVTFPLEFTRDEDLRPAFRESEYYASQQIFH